jgi:hypothetical protein
MSENLQKNRDGVWEIATPIPTQGLVARVEFALRDLGFYRLPNLLARWDERKLGR